MSSRVLLEILALTNVSCSGVGLGLRTKALKGVSLSSNAVLMAEDFIPGVKVEEKKVVSNPRVLLSVGDISFFLCEWLMSSLSCLIIHSGYPLSLNFCNSLSRNVMNFVGEDDRLSWIGI